MAHLQCKIHACLLSGTQVYLSLANNDHACHFILAHDSSWPRPVCQLFSFQQTLFLVLNLPPDLVHFGPQLSLVYSVSGGICHTLLGQQRDQWSKSSRSTTIPGPQRDKWPRSLGSHHFFAYNDMHTALTYGNSQFFNSQYIYCFGFRQFTSLICIQAQLVTIFSLSWFKKFWLTTYILHGPNNNLHIIFIQAIIFAVFCFQLELYCKYLITKLC